MPGDETLATPNPLPHNHETHWPETLAHGPDWVPPSPSDFAPRLPRFPGYEAIAELGRGGMGVVYRAREVRANRDVAIKVLLSGQYASTGELARFRTEAEAAANVQHPGVVQVLVVGDHEGNPFICMEYCGGGSLEQRLATSPLPSHEAAKLVAQLADAVQAAHARRVVHRDLKPSNVLFTNDGLPKITDFGLAKRLDGKDGLTASGAVMGTPSYMAPEQAAGLIQKIGPASDIYALGAILYRCLTGHPPFHADTITATLLKVMHHEPAAPRSIDRRVPRDLESVCLKCLAKRVEERYASAADLAADLRRFLDGQPVVAQPEPTLLRWRRRAWRNKTTLAASALAIVSLACALVILFHVNNAPHSSDTTIVSERPSKYALAIGVNEYQRLGDAGKRFPNLVQADRDAVNLATALADAGYSNDSVIVMSTNEIAGTARYPTSENVRHQLSALCDRLRETDSVFVAFSGYEAQFANEDDYFLCTVDSDKRNRQSMVSLSEVYASLAQAQAKSKAIVVDACRVHEGGTGGALRPRQPPPGIAVLFGTSAGESGFEEPLNLKSGVVSYFLRDAIRGSADADRDGTVTWSELTSHVRSQVPAYVVAKFRGKVQRPELMGETKDFVISRVK